MSVQTATSRVPEILAIIDSLEAGERRLLRDVSWEDYEQLLDDLGEGVAGKEKIDLHSDPPPDLVIEIDVTHSQRSKMKTYAHFGVPEFWRFRGKRFEIFELIGASYIARASSLAFPILRAEDIGDLIEQNRLKGDIAAANSFRKWAQARKTKA